MTYITYITYITHITYVTDSTYRTYSTYITDITYTLHDVTAHPDLWQLRAWEGEGDRGEKKQSCAHSCCQRSLTPIQAHALPSACRAESCLLCVARLSYPSTSTCQIVLQSASQREMSYPRRNQDTATIVALLA